MVDPKNVSFPLTLETFTALQQKDLSREVTAKELEFFRELVDMANETFDAAAHGDADTVLNILNAVNAVPVPDPYTRHLAALCRGWVLLACQSGADCMKAAIDGIS